MTKKYDQVAYNKKSLEASGKKVKSFTLDKETYALFEELSNLTGKSHIDVLRQALQDLHHKLTSQT